MAKVTVRVEKKKFDRKMQAPRRQGPSVAGQALLEEMQLAFRQSQKEIPVDTGAAKNSGQLIGPTQKGSRVRVEIAYGGAASKYIRRLHNDRTMRHPNGGKAGFIIDPVRQRLPQMQTNLRKRMARMMNDG